MNIIATLKACINALGGMNLRVDQENEGNIARAVIRTLLEVKNEVGRREQETAKAAGFSETAEDDKPEPPVKEG